MMLSVPKHGWVNISIGDWSDRASYLTEVHLDILDALINLFGNRKVSSVYCDAEGWEYIIVFDFYNIYIIEDKEENPKLYHFDMSAKGLAEEVYKDISEHLYDWSLWSYDVEDEEKRIKCENEIKEKLELLDIALTKF